MVLVKEYCCCAIPILNAGIYATLCEQFIVAVTAGILALVTPPIVGSSVPSWVSKVFAVLCFLTAGVQIFGFMGVFRESTVIFRRFTRVHFLITITLFSFSAVFLGISASKHNTATTSCAQTFFPPDPTATATALTGSDSEGKLLCNIFTWIGLGGMAALWVILAIFHAYLFFVITGYGTGQRADHSKYYSLYSLNSDPGITSGAHSSFLPGENIGMKDLNRGPSADVWDTRESLETVTFEKQQARQAQQTSGYPHYRQPSDPPFIQQQQAPQIMHRGTTQQYNPYSDPYYQDTIPAGARYQ